MWKSVIPAAAALGLAVVAGQAVTRAPAAGEGAAGWSLLHEGAMAKLAYGLPDSDQLALMLTCSPGDRTAVVYGDVQPRSPALILVGGPQSIDPLPIDPLSGGEAFEARLPLSDAALTGLARGGLMTVETEIGDRQLNASRAERRMVRDFLAYCETGRA